jgi:hypothetical protein
MKLSLSFSDYRCAVNVFYRFRLPDDFHETIWIHRSYFDSFGKAIISFHFSFHSVGFYFYFGMTLIPSSNVNVTNIRLIKTSSSAYL